MTVEANRLIVNGQWPLCKVQAICNSDELTSQVILPAHDLLAVLIALASGMNVNFTQVLIFPTSNQLQVPDLILLEHTMNCYTTQPVFFHHSCFWFVY